MAMQVGDDLWLHSAGDLLDDCGNHSCEPNLGIRGQIVYVALRDIAAGEELTYDWAMEENAPTRTRCRCGARRCRRVLSGRDWRIPRLQRRYRGYFSSYLEDKIRGRKR